MVIDKEEIEKLPSIGGIKSEEGVVIIDLGLMCDDVVRIQDTKYFSFELWSINSSEEKEVIIGSDKQTINHRYPNKYYSTISMKDGRYVCKYGFPVVLPHDDLRKVNVLAIKFHTATYILPISIETSDEKQFAWIKVLLAPFQALDKLLVITSNNERYTVDDNPFFKKQEHIPLFFNVVDSGDEQTLLITVNSRMSTDSIPIVGESDKTLMYY